MEYEKQIGKCRKRRKSPIDFDYHKKETLKTKKEKKCKIASKW